MSMQLRCRCGTVRGEMDTPRAYVRATCYCKDCRAFARFLGQPGVLDASGGTDIVATAPAAVRFTAGSEHVTCMSLVPQGPASLVCVLLPHAAGLDATRSEGALCGPGDGLIHAAAAGGGRGVWAARSHRDQHRISDHSRCEPRRSPSWRADCASSPASSVLACAASGPSPFFDASGRPLREPEVVSREQRAALERDAPSAPLEVRYRAPLPPFNAETAAQKVRLAEDAWNTRDPARVAAAASPPGPGRHPA